jgi:SNF2 family DNA or RNA helicase
VEIVGPHTIAVSFVGFFDNAIKDKIKGLPEAKYEGVSKDWILRRDLQETMYQAIGELCIEKGIKIIEIPEFVGELGKISIPFTQKAKTSNKEVKEAMVFGRDFNYQSEASYNKITLKDLPEKITSSLYEFQKKGIEFGLSRYGRVLLGDEMGVGKTV